MANKKLNSVSMDETNTGVATGAVFDNIERGKDRHGQQGTASAEEKAEREAQLKTRGRKGCKLERVSIGFSPDNLQYIRVMSSIQGLSITEFLNQILDSCREENEADFKEAQKLCNRLNKKGK